MNPKKKFLNNLELTKHYCSIKANETFTNYASALRTINPIIDGSPIFDYKLTKFDFKDYEDLILVKWNLIDDLEYGNAVHELFDKQIDIKKESFINNHIDSKGRILISDYLCTVMDGASEVESKGLVDIFDLPPIDTWFYIDKELGLLFSWIPDKFTDLINEAVLVNCVDILQWMNTNHDYYQYIFEEEKPIENENIKTLESHVKSRNGLFSVIKHWFENN